MRGEAKSVTKHYLDNPTSDEFLRGVEFVGQFPKEFFDVLADFPKDRRALVYEVVQKACARFVRPDLEVGVES